MYIQVAGFDRESADPPPEYCEPPPKGSRIYQNADVSVLLESLYVILIDSDDSWVRLLDRGLGEGRLSHASDVQLGGSATSTASTLSGTGAGATSRRRAQSAPPRAQAGPSRTNKRRRVGEGGGKSLYICAESHL